MDCQSHVGSGIRYLAYVIIVFKIFIKNLIFKED